MQVYRDIQGYRSTRIQVYRCTGMQVYRYTGIQVYRYTGIQVWVGYFLSFLLFVYSPEN